MVAEEYRLGLYITIPIYFVFLGGCAYWAHRRMADMKHANVTDQLSAHYLGGRTFGPILLAGTVFASFFSGYTVVGVVNEGFYTGWLSLRWMPSSAGIVLGYVGTGLRLRKASRMRNHQSPIDFITDRYQSNFLRYTLATLQVATSVIYVSAQVIALKSTFNSMFEIDPDSPWAVVVMFAIILVFEWVGGLASVALTDCVQGIIMAISFLLIAGVVKQNFGGWAALDPINYPKPQFYQTPTDKQQWNFWQFSLLLISFSTLPHLMQRLYAANDLRSIKFAWKVMCLGPWLTMFVSAFLGTVGVSILNGQLKSNSPYSDILEAIMSLGGFPEAVGIISFTAALAAIMSTADSLVIAISQLITAEVVYPLRPQSTPNQIAWAGRFVSLLTVIVALLIGLFWDEGISDLGKIQFPLSLMVVPGFCWGLFASDKYDAHPWSIAVGAIASSIYIFLIYFLYIKPNKNARPVEAGITGLALQLGIIVLAEIGRRMRWWYLDYKKKRDEMEDIPVDKDDPAEEDTGITEYDGVRILLPNRPLWDIPHLQRFGDHPLTPRLLNTAMEGVNESLRDLWFTFFFLFALTLVTPLVPENEPPLNADNTFLFPPAVVNGLPWWAFKLIIMCIVPYLMTMVVIWRVPTEWPVDEDKVAKHGVDPDTVSLTYDEMGRRTSYDDRNESVSHRRRTIQVTMKELGIADDDEMVASQEQAVTDVHRRLSAMVLGTVQESAAEAAKQVQEDDVEESEYVSASGEVDYVLANDD